jgi:hypothetical protein
MVDFSQHRFRCSSLGHLMTEPLTKADKDAGNLSEGTKTHLVDVYVHLKYGRQTDITSKYIAKGLMVEEDGITLYIRMKKKFFKKNEEHLKNDFIMGTPDIFDGPSIYKATEITDIKCSWDIYTFYRTLTKKINQLYYWQLQGYMWLTGAKTAVLAYCLINTPDVFLNDEKRKLFYKMGVVSEENEIYLEACQALELSMLYDDIPLNERLLEFRIERNDADIARIENRVIKCRQFLAELQEQLTESELILN